MDNRFTDIIHLIKQSRTNAIKAVNAELLNLYWNIGEHISYKIEQSEWVDSVVTELSNFMQTYEPEIKRFLDTNICRMKQFYGAFSQLFKTLSIAQNFRKQTFINVLKTNNVMFIKQTFIIFASLYNESQY
jgi:hypothetical protein